MTIFEFLKNPIFNLPNVSQANKYETIFIDAMNEYFDLFEKLEDFEIHQDNVRKVSAVDLGNKAYELSSGIINTLKEYYNGKPYEAFYEFKALMDGSNFVFNTELLHAGKDFYRMRAADIGLQFTAKEIFHIPYHLKNKIATQRYSIPSFPSLYLSDSIYTCWAELKRPPMDELHISRFSLKEGPYQVLQIPHPKEIIAKNGSGKQITEGIIGTGIDSLLMNFPLYLACSVGIKNPLDPFKVEYVIPQLLLQYVRQHKDLHGIKYFSTNVAYENPNIKGSFNNYVFPVQSVATEGYCPELSSMFQLTEPASVKSILTTSDLKVKPFAVNSPIHSIEGEKGESVTYGSSKFGQIEIALARMKANPLSFD
ncbi:MAG: hypothetical protein GQ574_28250 [Crocinitomix sp.]|nr:hypothetical protein [Crocinitomix sp.]